MGVLWKDFRVWGLDGSADVGIVFRVLGEDVRKVFRLLLVWDRGVGLYGDVGDNKPVFVWTVLVSVPISFWINPFWLSDRVFEMWNVWLNNSTDVVGFSFGSWGLIFGSFLCVPIPFWGKKGRGEFDREKGLVGTWTTVVVSIFLDVHLLDVKGLELLESLAWKTESRVVSWDTPERDPGVVLVLLWRDPDIEVFVLRFVRVTELLSPKDVWWTAGVFRNSRVWDPPLVVIGCVMVVAVARVRFAWLLDELLTFRATRQ